MVNKEITLGKHWLTAVQGYSPFSSTFVINWATIQKQADSVPRFLYLEIPLNWKTVYFAQTSQSVTQEHQP